MYARVYPKPAVSRWTNHPPPPAHPFARARWLMQTESCVSAPSLLTLLLLLPFAAARAPPKPPPKPRPTPSRAPTTPPTPFLPTPSPRPSRSSTPAPSLHFGEALWGILTLWLILEWRIAARMRNVAVNLSKNRWAQGFVFFFQFLLLTTLLSLPFDLYHHHIGLHYGLSVQSWPSWFGDQLKTFGLVYIIGGLLVMLLFWIIRKFPRRWWLVLWFPVMALSILGVFLQPGRRQIPCSTASNPSSNTNPALVTQLERVVARGKGISIPPAAHVPHARLRQGHHPQRLRHRLRRVQARRRLGYLHRQRHARRNPLHLRPRDGPLRPRPHPHLRALLLRRHPRFVLSRLPFLPVPHAPLRRPVARALAGQLGPPWSSSRSSSRSSASSPNPSTTPSPACTSTPPTCTARRPSTASCPTPRPPPSRPSTSSAANSFDDPNPNPFVVFWTYSHPSIAYRAAFARAYNPWAPGANPPTSPSSQPHKPGCPMFVTAAKRR